MPSWPRKYFWATMLVAFWDQLFGNSTPRCSKAGLSGSPITASRISHSISSKGCTPAVENRRSIERPCRPFLGLAVAVLDIELLLSQRLLGVTAQDRSPARTGTVSKCANKRRIGEVVSYILTTPLSRQSALPLLWVHGRRPAQGRRADGGEGQRRPRRDGRARRQEVGMPPQRGGGRRDRRGQAEAARHLPQVGLLRLARPRRRR